MKKLFSALLALACVSCCGFSLVACGIFGGEDGGIFGGQNKSEFASGEGTQESPYVVAEDYQWLNVAKHPDACFELAADINLGDYDTVSPTGTSDAPFEGTIDGKNHAIVGATIKSSHTPGLFGVLSGATVKNLRFENSSVAMTSGYSDGEYMGSFVGIARKGAEIENCHTKNISLTFYSQTSYFNFVGGFAGSIESVSSVNYCSCDVKISCSSGKYPGFWIGGFAVTVSGSAVDCCSVTGSMTFPGYAATSVMDIGAFVYEVKTSTITNMCAEMDINAHSNIDTYTMAGNVDSESLKYCLNFNTYQASPKGRYKKCGLMTDVSEKVNIYFDSSKYAEANATLDGSLWEDNHYWKKGKIHPELVSYEEYLALRNGV